MTDDVPSFLGQFLEIFFNAAAVGGGQLSRIDVGYFGFVVPFCLEGGDFEGEIPELVHQLLEALQIVGQFAFLQFAFQVEKNLIAALVAAVSLAQAGLQVEERLLALLGLILGRYLPALLQLLD